MLWDVLRTLWGYIQNPQSLVEVAGYVGLTAIVFAETGLLFGFFLPGDSLLFAAGLFAAQGSPDFQVVPLLGLLTAAAIVGDGVGYAIGRKAGPFLYQKKESFFFRRSHLIQAKEFYELHGGKTIVLARFIPIVRTFAPTVAGIAHMPYARFAAFNVTGGFLWVWSLVLGGYYLGLAIPNLNDYIHFILGFIILVSVAPVAFKWWRGRTKITSQGAQP